MSRIICYLINLHARNSEILEILVNDSKETQTKINREYVTTKMFDTFYNDYIDFKHYINDILKILNERKTTSTKKPSVSEQILLLEEQVRILKLENKKLQEERKAQLNIIERFTENQDSDFRKGTGNDWTPARPSKNNKGLSSRQNTVPELQNSNLPLQVEDLVQQILVEENSATVLPEERNTILDNVISRRPNICTTEKYIQAQQQWQKSKVVPRNKTYAGTLREG